MKKIIFDFDGVIVDSMPYYVQAVEEILLAYKKAYLKNDITKDISFFDAACIAKDLIEKFEINEKEETLINFIRNRGIEAYKDTSTVKETVVDTISELHSKGYSLNILTSTPRILVEPYLQKLGIYSLFDNILSCGDLGAKKDDVNLFYTVARLLETAPENCIYADDNIVPLTTAKKANMKVVGVFDHSSSNLNGQIKSFCDGYIYQLREILPIIYDKKFESVNEYIKFNWENVIRVRREDTEQYVGLPYSFTVPAVGYFETLYYWDTYFTNVGLLLDGKAMLAKNNTDNMLYLVDKYGFMPNSNGTYHLDHSQPPFLSVMVRELYDYYGDKVWLRSSYEMLKKEYEYWMTQRTTPIGLNRYDTSIEDREYLATRAADYEERIHRSLPYDRSDIGRHYLATCESGYDCSSRFEFDIYNYAPVCLNSLLYDMEVNMSFFAKELGNTDAEAMEWIERSEKRKKLMKQYMLDEYGCFRDYNYVTGKLSNDFSCASVFPLSFGLADEKNASDFMGRFAKLEAEYGVLANAKNDVEGSFQWGYPNGWAPHQMLVIRGLDNYGYYEDAERIADKYVRLVDKVFDKTQTLWEKYNVIDGSNDVEDEAQGGMPPMMGWTAGAYIYAQSYLEKRKN